MGTLQWNIAEMLRLPCAMSSLEILQTTVCQYPKLSLVPVSWWWWWWWWWWWFSTYGNTTTSTVTREQANSPVCLPTGPIRFPFIVDSWYRWQLIGKSMYGRWNQYNILHYDVSLTWNTHSFAINLGSSNIMKNRDAIPKHTITCR